MEPVKAIFKKLENGKEYTSTGYYLDEEDFNSKNNTLFFIKLTNKTKPEPKVKNDNKTIK